jgi:hypothetical protein
LYKGLVRPRHHSARYGNLVPTEIPFSEGSVLSEPTVIVNNGNLVPMQCRNIDAAMKGMSRKKIRKSKKQKTLNKVKIECLLTYALDYRNNCISEVGRKRTESEIKNEKLPPTIKGRGSRLIKIIPLK